MNRIQRKFFTLFFVLLFALIAPTVVLYAQGYRFSLKNNVFVYSGSITVKSWPRNINIAIDNKKQKGKNLNVINGSYTINGIKPGEYTLTCSKPGYSTWEKKINVHSGVSTEFWNVLLFPETNYEKVKSGDSSEKIKQIFLSPKNENELILFSEKQDLNEIYILDTEEEKQELIFRTQKYDFLDKKEGFNVEWNADNKKIILPVLDSEKQKRFLLVDLDDNDVDNFIVLDNFFEKGGIHQARWMFDEKNELALLTKKGSLYSFDYKKKNSELIAENVSAFDFAEYNIFYSQLPNNIVWKVKQNNFKHKEQITNKPLSLKDKELFIKLTAYDEYRVFLNGQMKSLLHNENNKKDTVSDLILKKQIKGIQFSDDGKKLLTWNEHEIWYYMLRDWEIQPKRYFKDRFTITRSSEPIKNVQWMDNYENIILSTNRSIKSFEVDPRSTTNISDIFNIQNSLPISEKDLIYNKDTQIAYLLNDNTIYKSILLDTSGFLNFR